MAKSEIITAKTMVVQSKSFLTAEMDDDLVMMSLENNAYFGLDDIGKIIWETIAQPQTVDTLCKTLMTHYAVEKDVCMADTIAFLTELYDEKMVELV